DHRRWPVVTDVPRREARVGADLPGEEAVSQRLAGDDPDVRLSRGVEDFFNPFLAEQAEGDLQDFRRPGLEAERRLRGFVDGDSVVIDFVFRLQGLEDLVRFGVAHQLRRRTVDLVHVDMRGAGALERAVYP